jgi:hypothetical protein
MDAFYNHNDNVRRIRTEYIPSRMKAFAHPPVAPQKVETAVPPPPSTLLAEAGEDKSDFAGSTTEDPTKCTLPPSPTTPKIDVEQSVVTTMIPPTTMATGQGGEAVGRLPPLPTGTRTEKGSEVVQTTITPPTTTPIIKLGGEVGSRVVLPPTATHLGVETTITAPPAGLFSETTNVDESTVSTADAPKVVVEQVEPAKVTAGRQHPKVVTVEVLVDNENEGQRLALASFFNGPKNVTASTKPQNRKRKQKEGKTASKLSLKKNLWSYQRTQ